MGFMNLIGLSILQQREEERVENERKENASDVLVTNTSKQKKQQNFFLIKNRRLSKISAPSQKHSKNNSTQDSAENSFFSGGYVGNILVAMELELNEIRQKIDGMLNLNNFSKVYEFLMEKISEKHFKKTVRLIQSIIYPGNKEKYEFTGQTSNKVKAITKDILSKVTQTSKLDISGNKQTM